MIAINKHSAKPKNWSVEMPNAPYLNRYRAFNDYTMKQLLFLILSILIISCEKSYNDIVVDLKSSQGYGPFTPRQIIIWPTSTKLDYRNVPDDIQEYVVRKLDFQPEQSYWHRYLNKEVSPEKFEKYISDYGIDTTKLTKDYVDSEVLFLIGTKSNKRVIIIDSDNDGDFSNESILEYVYPLDIKRQKEISKTLPAIRTQYEIFDDNNIISKNILIKPSPYKGSLGIGFSTDNEIEKKYYLFASFPEYKKGSFTVNNNNYEIHTSNGFIKNYYGSDTKIFIVSSEDTLPSTLKGDIPYEIGDIFNIDEHDFSIDSITISGDKLFIKYLGANVYPVGVTEGYFLPKFKSQYIDYSVFTLENYPDQYVLLDFWGTWCIPCIKLIPELKKLNSEFENKPFALVSIAYDTDRKKVKSFVEKESMKWDHLFVDQDNTDANSIVEKLKITSFPTTILIDPQGKIIARDKSLDELKVILKNAL